MGYASHEVVRIGAPAVLDPMIWLVLLSSQKSLVGSRGLGFSGEEVAFRRARNSIALMHLECVLRGGFQIGGVEGHCGSRDGHFRRTPHERGFRVAEHRLVPGDVERIHIGAAEKPAVTASVCPAMTSGCATAIGL